MTTQALVVDGDSWRDLSADLSLQDGKKYLLQNRDNTSNVKLHIGGSAPADDSGKFSYLPPLKRIGHEQVSGESIYARSLSNAVTIVADETR